MWTTSACGTAYPLPKHTSAVLTFTRHLALKGDVKLFVTVEVQQPLDISFELIHTALTHVHLQDSTTLRSGSHMHRGCAFWLQRATVQAVLQTQRGKYFWPLACS